MRIVFMGSPAFSVTILDSLVTAGHDVVAVYCQPPRKKGRGHTVQKGPVHERAELLGIPVLTPASLRTDDAQREFQSHTAEVAIVAAYGLILPTAILLAPTRRCINVHASLLPRWRGAAPIQRAILAGDTETGITIMQMDAGLDTGDILAMASIPVTTQTTTQTLHDELSVMGAGLLIQTLQNLDEITPIPQPIEGVTYAHKLSKDEGLLDFSLSANELGQRVRALNPWPGTWFDHDGIIVKVLEAEVLDQPAPDNADHPWIIPCGSGFLSLKTVQRAGSKPLNAADFLRGIH
ncbi:MAG: methionyl-tRNA formyltransferase [Alphaproteobacteria bacterium]|nr:methionyl-tRNA formyltransferase [Alphaproteobacteria bacterium]